MDLGPIKINCQPAANIDPMLLEHLMTHFRPIEEVGATLTVDEFFQELIVAYFSKYMREFAETGVIKETDTLETGSAKLAKINLEVIDCLISDQAKSTLLLRHLIETSAKNLAIYEATALRNPLFSILNNEFNSQLFMWETLVAVAKAE